MKIDLNYEEMSLVISALAIVEAMWKDEADKAEKIGKKTEYFEKRDANAILWKKLLKIKNDHIRSEMKKENKDD